MFKRATGIRTPVVITFESQSIEAEAGETIAAALLAAGVSAFRTSAEDGNHRGPYCMIGNCFDCMVQIKGVGGRQACRERVQAGLQINRHQGLPEPEDDA